MGGCQACQWNGLKSMRHGGRRCCCCTRWHQSSSTVVALKYTRSRAFRNFSISPKLENRLCSLPLSLSPSAPALSPSPSPSLSLRALHSRVPSGAWLTPAGPPLPHASKVPVYTLPASPKRFSLQAGENRRLWHVASAVVVRWVQAVLGFKV